MKMFIIRKSLFSSLPKLIIFGLLSAVPAVGGFLFFKQSQPVLATLSLIGSFYFAYKLLLTYTIWRFSYIKINIDDIEHFSSSSIFKESVTVINFSDISNISFERKGILSSISGSGIIILQTSSGEFRFYNAKGVEQAYAKLKGQKANYSKLEPKKPDDEHNDSSADHKTAENIKQNLEEEL
ncbi:MAG TPA: hypothetical protein PKA29_02805 [Candidatus Saccharibacteria bacterium]|nr:hypothetical protein [Candidatus Saccharibacteria bacterium]